MADDELEKGYTKRIESILQACLAKPGLRNQELVMIANTLALKNC
jgi:hypothetical protein